MAIAYSYDLRVRAIDLVNSGTGTNVTTVARMLRIGRSTLYMWLDQVRQGEDIKPKSNWQRGHSHKVTDLKKFEEFVDKNSDLTLDELTEKWGTAGRSTVNRALKKIGYTKKKRPLDTLRETKKKGEIS